MADADVKISELPAEASPTPAALVPIVQDGVTSRTTLAAIGTALASLLSAARQPLVANASRDFDADDIGKELLSTGVTLTLPLDEEILPVGTFLYGTTTAGQTTFAVEGGGTLTPLPGCESNTRGVGSPWEIYRASSTVFYLRGDLELT